MNISNHCFERYHERVKGKTTPFVDSMKSKYSDEIEKLYLSCDHIYFGVIGHSTRPVDVNVNKDGWVIISNDKENTLITLYKVDLGVNDNELNKQFIEKSLEMINSCIYELDLATKEVEKEKVGYREIIAHNEELIKEMNVQISKLKAQNEAYNDLIKVADTKLYQSKVDLRDAIENYMVKDAVKVEMDVK